MRGLIYWNKKENKKMEQELLSVLIDVHNKLLNISVKGDDAIRMGEVLNELRMTYTKAQQQSNEMGG